MRACVIFNPAAKGDKARHFRKHLDQFGASVALKPTQAAGDGRRLAAEAVAEDFDTIVAAGGDGTLNEVLNGIADAPEGLAKARLGVLPLGTVNVFAKEIGLPMDLAKAWEAIQRGNETKIDLPFVEFGSPTGPVGGAPTGAGEAPAFPSSKTQRRYFAQMAGAGLDARAIELVDWEEKKRISQMAYVLAGCRAMRERLPAIRVMGDDGPATGELVLIGNGRFYGGTLPVFHHADSSDGLLDVVVFPRVSWGTIIRYAVGFVTNRAPLPSDLRYFQTARLTLESGAPVSFQVEGEVAGKLPATFGMLPKALRVVVP